jgi:hypothetical protein
MTLLIPVIVLASMVPKPYLLFFSLLFLKEFLLVPFSVWQAAHLLPTADIDTVYPNWVASSSRPRSRTLLLLPPLTTPTIQHTPASVVPVQEHSATEDENSLRDRTQKVLKLVQARQILLELESSNSGEFQFQTEIGLLKAMIRKLEGIQLPYPVPNPHPRTQAILRKEILEEIGSHSVLPSPGTALPNKSSSGMVDSIVDPEWKRVLASEFSQQYFIEIERFVKSERSKFPVYPEEQVCAQKELVSTNQVRKFFPLSTSPHCVK